MKVFRAILWMFAGSIYTMLFAKRTGKELRKDVSKAKKEGKSILSVLWKEGRDIDLEALEEIKKSTKDNKNIQSLIERSKSEIQKATDIAKKKGGDIAEDMVSILKSISKDASKKAAEISNEIKDKTIKKGQEIQAKAKEKVSKIKK